MAHRLAPTLRPLFGPAPAVVSTQNGIPWWYFQGYGGELEKPATRARRSRWVIASSIEPRRVVGSLAVFRDQHRRARSDQAHGREQDQLRRAGRHQVRPREEIAEPLIAAGFRCPINQRFRHEIWVKLLGNVGVHPISALTRGTLEELARDPDVSSVVRALMAGNRGRWRGS